MDDEQVNQGPVKQLECKRYFRRWLQFIYSNELREKKDKNKKNNFGAQEFVT